MGGIGSGCWYRFNSRNTTGEYIRLDVRSLAKAGVLRPGASTSWAWKNDSGKSIATIQIDAHAGFIILRYRVTTPNTEAEDLMYRVGLSWTPCNFGGQRPWFLCPAVGCGRRVALLYLDRYFVCRHCLNLAYASQQETKEYRLMHKAHAIRRRLGGSTSPLDSLPDKPRGMHYRTYYRLLMEAKDAEAQSWKAAAERFGGRYSALFGDT